MLIVFVLTALLINSALSQTANPLFSEKKVKNYMPHMTWAEVEDALKRTDVAIIPTGSIEQHGKHLPLGTDTYASTEVAKLIAQETDVLVAPPVIVGLSEHHMGFPGSMTLSPETFEAVLFEYVQSLMHHGITKILVYNGHGGNSVSVTNVIQKINQETKATAIFLNEIQVPRMANAPKMPDYDWHAGVGETSSMLYLCGSVVDMSKAEKPVLTFPPVVYKALENMKDEPNLQAVMWAHLFRPLESGKRASSREMSNIGVFTAGDPSDADAAFGKSKTDHFIKAAVKFIEEWKKVGR